MKYGEMGVFMGVKEEMDTIEMPYFSFTLLLNGEKTKKTKF